MTCTFDSRSRFPAPAEATTKPRAFGRRQFKAALSALLRPLTRVAAGPAESMRRLWAHAWLANQIGSLDPSVVILGQPEVRGTCRVVCGNDLLLYPGLYLETRERGTIHLGDRVVCSRGVHLVSYSRIQIGAGTMIGEYASVRDANHRIQTGDTLRDAGHVARPVIVGRDVWIGRGVTVLPGIEIGDGAVVGANAVVTRSVAPGAIVAGVPARPLTSRRSS